jgi:predicted amidophosphoribosyltransferase
MGLYYPSRGDPSSAGWNDFLSKHIRGLKRYPGYATPLGLGLSLCITKIYTELQKMDLIVPVPKFASEVISAETGISFADALEKLREQKMRGLAMDERWGVVKGLYGVRDKGVVERRKVILVDDVFTSGATVSECSDMLLRAGSECVNVLVAGRDTG